MRHDTVSNCGTRFNGRAPHACWFEREREKWGDRAARDGRASPPPPLLLPFPLFSDPPGLAATLAAAVPAAAARAIFWGSALGFAWFSPLATPLPSSTDHHHTPHDAAGEAQRCTLVVAFVAAARSTLACFPSAFVPHRRHPPLFVCCCFHMLNASTLVPPLWSVVVFWLPSIRTADVPIPPPLPPPPPFWLPLLGEIVD